MDWFESTNDAFAVDFIMLNDAKFEIEPRQVSLSTASQMKVYDGQPLRVPNVAVGGDGFVEDNNQHESDERKQDKLAYRTEND